MPSKPNLIDPFGRAISYLRLSVTDRCDFRCTYCMAEDMVFTPRNQLLTLEELAFIGTTFVELGVNKIRITGGEPLIRRNVISLLNTLGQTSIGDLAITTNGSQLKEMAESLYKVGVKRLNVSLDTLQPSRFKKLTRTGNLEKVLEGIQHASNFPFERIKINSVILRHENDDEIIDLIDFARKNNFDISFIEEMPLGEINSHSRAGAFIASEEIRGLVNQHYTVMSSSHKTGGPSRYWQLDGESSTSRPIQIGFISPHSHNFCGDCNRVRLTAEGRLLLCLGNEHSIDLRAVVRKHPNDKEALIEAIQKGVEIKPKEHHFDLNAEPDIIRFMNKTGG